MTRRHSRRSSVRSAGLVLIAAGALAALSGCYERTVGARGFGADSAKVSAGNLRTGQDDRVLGYKKIDTKPIPPVPSSTP